MMTNSIAHYKTLEKLGEGGMGEVCLTEETRLGRKVALKLLPASYQYDLVRRDALLGVEVMFNLGGYADRYSV